MVHNRQLQEIRKMALRIEEKDVKKNPKRPLTYDEKTFKKDKEKRRRRAREKQRERQKQFLAKPTTQIQITVAFTQKHCKECGKPIYRRNQSGLCKTCISKKKAKLMNKARRKK